MFISVLLVYVIYCEFYISSVQNKTITKCFYAITEMDYF